jgi:calcineurin-like phosphoesterase family protein
MGRIFFTSDTHFSHKNSLRYCGRPFLTTKAMDEAMINAWNSLITDNDTVYHLGDVSMHTSPIKRILPRLKGKKILIVGNHDLIFPYYEKRRGKKFVEKMFKEYLEAGFSEIIQGPREYTFYVNPTQPGGYKGFIKAKLNHFPTKETIDPKYEKIIFNRYSDDGTLNICGHVHEAWLKYGSNVNVGVDVWEFSPVDLEDVVNLYLNGKYKVKAPNRTRIFVWKMIHNVLNLFKKGLKNE